MKKIPNDWKPWRKIAWDHDRMEDILLAVPKKKRLLYALCMSAAKWITSDVGGTQVVYSSCGLCVFKAIEALRCVDCVLCRDCVKRARDGEAMQLYAEEFAKFNKKK